MRREPLDTIIHRLLGCEWGYRIALPDDKEPCRAQATQRVALHGVPGDGDVLVQLCEPHGVLVMGLTDPHVPAPDGSSSPRLH